MALPHPDTPTLDNATAFRVVNERIRGEADSDQTIFICECNSPDCMGTVELTLGEYEFIRSRPGRLVLRPGHSL
jgi:hypothetical protein